MDNTKLTTFIKGILAGICIAIGGAVFLALLPDHKIAGAIFFSVGLLTICTQGFNLFTGKACYILDNKPAYLLDLVIVWIGNVLGTFIIACFIRWSRLSASLCVNAENLIATKNADSLVSLFFLGAICNMLIYIAVEGYKSNPHEVGKYLSLVFGVTVFILIGSEHSVADMFYYAAAGQLFTAQGILRLVVISIGNVFGGLVIPAGKKLCA